MYNVDVTPEINSVLTNQSCFESDVLLQSEWSQNKIKTQEYWSSAIEASCEIIADLDPRPHGEPKAPDKKWFYCAKRKGWFPMEAESVSALSGVPPESLPAAEALKFRSGR